MLLGKIARLRACLPFCFFCLVLWNPSGRVVVVTPSLRHHSHQQLTTSPATCYYRADGGWGEGQS